jgi:hypothetical protein
MNRGKYIIVTNNPMVMEKHGSTRNVIYKNLSYEGVLREVRDRIHEGHSMLTHPLSGSVKPNETPYKSIMLSEERRGIDERSVMLIENAIHACGKFEFKSDRYKPEVYKDFQLIDCTLIESGMASADALY